MNEEETPACVAGMAALTGKDVLFIGDEKGAVGLPVIERQDRQVATT